jgi:hypothetical protein
MANKAARVTQKGKFSWFNPEIEYAKAHARAQRLYERPAYS